MWKIKNNPPRSLRFWHTFYLLVILNILLWSLVTVPTVKEFRQSYIQIPEAAASAPGKPDEASAPAIPVVYDQAWALSEVERAGIDPIKVKCLIKHESGGDPNNVNPDEGNADLGFFQWSSKYQVKPGFISLDCIGDIKCETEKFIEKVKKDGNFSAWHGYTRNCKWLEE